MLRAASPFMLTALALATATATTTSMAPASNATAATKGAKSRWDTTKTTAVSERTADPPKHLYVCVRFGSEVHATKRFECG